MQRASSGRWACRTARLAHTYSKTLNLPKSDLPNRSDRKKVPQLISKTSEDVYNWQKAARSSQPPHILHDGPPYANGDLHLGHALNKILKDIINRFNVQAGRLVNYRPGWDCHGLPIELASLERAKKKKKMPKTIVERRAVARALALGMVEKQKEKFRSFAVMADWEGGPEATYKTLTSDYVVRQLRVFAKMMHRGLIFRQRKPVYWSVESSTALAESELQYGEIESPTCTVAYEICGLDSPAASSQSDVDLSGASLVIWTTTPWTLVANQLISINKDITYCLVDTEKGRLVVAESLVASVGTPDQIVATFPGSTLLNITYKCPLTGDVRLVVHGDHVTDASGTGLVHSASGHGKEDYLVGQKNNVPIFSPVDGAGKYTSELPESLSELVGLDARKQGSPRILEMLQECGALIDRSKISHSVPFDWRSKTPVMVRSTPQFFIDLSGVRDKALQSLDGIAFKPASGSARLRAFVQARTEWCVSRQRVWGVPIPVLLNKQTDEALMDEDCVEHVISHIESLGENGVNHWFDEQEDITEWLPARLASQAHNYRKGTDTMDVWFDSGTSWTMLPETQRPVDYYLEGSDQHRGWFQSSLLTHVAYHDRAQAPYKTLITHGFTLDEHQQKMSKSLKNVVSPDELINGSKKFPALGVDGLRLFIAQCDYTGDIALSPVAVNQVASTVKKLRLTFKYLLGNLEGYQPREEPPQLGPLDRHALSQLTQMVDACKAAYEDQQFSQVIKTLQVHMNSRLSSFYFDTAKDILYADSVNSPRRIAIQYVLHQLLEAYVRILAPVTPLLAQEVWEHCPEYVQKELSHVAMAGWPEVSPAWKDEALDNDIAQLQAIRKIVNDAIETARADKKVGSSLACDIYIEPSPENEQILNKYKDHLETIFIASKVHLGPAPASEWSYSFGDATKATVVPPSHAKCPRCWQFIAASEEDLCNRCEDAVSLD